MRVAVIDGQGGGMGKHIVEQLRKRMPDLEILALGTNALATGAMLKAGATEGFGEAAICYNANRVDIITGSLAITTVHGFLGEITPNIAAAISSSTALKLLIPIQRNNIIITGVNRMPLPHHVEQLVEEIAKRVENPE